MKSRNDLEKLYSKEYVTAFKSQNPFRLTRLMKYIHLEDTYSVADFACGNGMLMELVVPAVKSYIGVDFSERFIEAANARKENLFVPNAQFECANIVEFCQQHQRTFDAAFALDFSEHVYDTEWLELLQSIRSSLKPEGKLYLHTPNADFFLEILKANNFLLKQFPEHVAVRTPYQNAQMLQKAGFQITKLKFIAHYHPVLRIIHPFSYIPILGKYFRARIFVQAIA